MKKFIFTFTILLNISLIICAQSPINEKKDSTITTNEQVQEVINPTNSITTNIIPEKIIKYGYISYTNILESLPEYKIALDNFKNLKAKYDAETKHNEERFTNMFVDFLNGQKNFPQTILLKRQKELQTEMERSISFREDIKKLLDKAQQEMMGPITNRLDSAIRLVGEQKEYEYILNTDGKTYPFIQRKIAEDATPFIIEAFKKIN